MRIVLSSLVIASSLLAVPFSFADTLPICGSANDTMLGACQSAEEIHVFSAKDLVNFAPSSPLPTLSYIGETSIIAAPSLKLEVMKTLPLELYPRGNSFSAQRTSSSSIDTENALPDAFPIPYLSLEDVKTQTLEKGIILKTLPISSAQNISQNTSQNVFSPVSQKISERVHSDVNKNLPFVSRGEACQIVAEIINLPLFEASREMSIFSDVSSEAHYFSAINALKNAQIVDGYEDGSFQPDQNIVYSESYKVLAIAFDFAKSTDEKKGNDWFVPFKTALGSLASSADDAQVISRTDWYKLLDAIVSQK